MSLINPPLFTELTESVPWLKTNNALKTRLLEAYTENSSQWIAVNCIIDSLDLQPYKTEPVEEQEHELLKAAPDPVPARVSEAVDMQRRVSIDLMLKAAAVPAIRRPSLSKAAETAVSAVSVVTKVTELENGDYKPLYTQRDPRTKGLHYRLAFQRERWDPLKMRRKSSESPEEASTEPASPTVDTALTTSDAIKAARRMSLVTKHLPLYIRDQLVPTPTISQAGLPEPTSVTPMLPGTGDLQVVTSKKGTPQAQLQAASTSSANPSGKTENARINNLLANSLSFYYNDDHEPNISVGDTSSVSEADKEYILPSLFARSEDYGHSTAYGHMGDETDGFELDDEDDEDDDDDEDDEDDYLFR